MYTTKTDDQELIRAYIEGNELALKYLLDKHQGRIFAYIVSYVKDSDLADDLFQETFIKVIRIFKSGRYNEEGKFIPWVMRIAYNMVIDYFRKQKRESAYVSKGVESEHLENIEELNEENFSLEELADISDQLSSLIEELPDDQQKVLKMRFYFNLSFKEIAEETNVSINTSLGRMRYAIINLRKLATKRNSAILKY